MAIPENRKLALFFIILIYFLSFIAPPVSLFLSLLFRRSAHEKIRLHAKRILLFSLIDTAAFAVLFFGSLIAQTVVLYSVPAGFFIAPLFVVIMLLFAIAGGIAARLKNDFVSRGFFISLLTWKYGFVILLTSANSEARLGDDKRYWPVDGGLAAILMSFQVFFLFLVLQFIRP